MARYERDTAVLFKIETNYGVDALPVPASDAILVRKFTHKRDFKYVANPEVRPYMGGNQEQVAMTWISGTFEVALAASGTPGTPAVWSRFLRASAFAAAVGAAPARVDYTPISTSIESGTLYYYDSGVLKKALGVRCNLTGIKLPYGDNPILTFAYMGVDGGDTAVVTPGTTLTSWNQPIAVNQANSGLLTIGCTYAAGALVGGTTYTSRGLEANLGGKLEFMELLGGEAADFTDRDAKGKIVLDLTAAQEVANLATVKAGTRTGIGLLHGTTAGSKILMHLPNCQLKNPTPESYKGRRLIGYDLNIVPTLGTGNDEMRIAEL